MIRCDVCKKRLLATQVTVIEERFQVAEVREVCGTCLSLIDKALATAQDNHRNIIRQDVKRWILEEVARHE